MSYSSSSWSFNREIKIELLIDLVRKSKKYSI